MVGIAINPPDSGTSPKALYDRGAVKGNSRGSRERVQRAHATRGTAANLGPTAERSHRQSQRERASQAMPHPSSCCLPFRQQCSAVAALWAEVPRVARWLVALAPVRSTSISFDRGRPPRARRVLEWSSVTIGVLLRRNSGLVGLSRLSLALSQLSQGQSCLPRKTLDWGLYQESEDFRSSQALTVVSETEHASCPPPFLGYLSSPYSRHWMKKFGRGWPLQRG